MTGFPQKPGNSQMAGLNSVREAIGIITHVGRFVGASLGCALLGAVAGAVLGGLISLFFIVFGGLTFGWLMGAIGGFAAGFIGACFGGSQRFCTAGIIGGVVSIFVFPYAALILVPPFLSIGAGYLFGDYLDRELSKERPPFFLARVIKRLIIVMDSYAGWVRVAYGIAGSAAVTTTFIWLAWKSWHLR